MDLSTTYLGLRLQHPIMPGASPLGYDLDKVRHMEDVGAAAIVLPSLFEEQIVEEQLSAHNSMVTHANSFAEALTYLPDPDDFRLGPQEYLERVRTIKETVHIPVIASLNGVSDGYWVDYARLIEQAGADALELNVYYLSMKEDETSEFVEGRTLALVREVREGIQIPFAVKLSPFYSALASFAKVLEDSGAHGLVLFNRFYQPDIDTEELDVIRVNLSQPSELLLRLRWLAILSAQRTLSLAASGGVHDAFGAVKAIMAGANAVQMVSALLHNGPDHLGDVVSGLMNWLEEHEYESLAQLQGSMNLSRCPDPSAYERANYVQILQSWRN